MRNSDDVYRNRYVYLHFRNVYSVEVRKGTFPSVTHDTLYAPHSAPSEGELSAKLTEGSNVATSGIVGSS